MRLLSFPFFCFPSFIGLVFFIKRLERLQKGFTPFFVKDRTEAYKFTGIIPFAVAEQDVECVKLKNLDASVEIARRVCAGMATGAAAGWTPPGRQSCPLKMVRYIEVRGTGRCEIGLKALLVKLLRASMGKEKRCAASKNQC